MNRILLFIVFSKILYTQESICANPILFKINNEIQRELECLDSQFKIRKNVLQNGTSDNYFECVDFIFMNSYSDSLTHIYIESEQYDDGNISLNALETIFTYFSSSTPDAEKNEYKNGIKSFEENIFGLPPNKDGSNVVNILILDIRDNFTGSGNYIAGYFDRNDQTDNLTSNQKDIIYIDCNPVDLLSEYPQEALYTIAHEYEHLLHYNSDPNEIIDNDDNFNPWLDEGLADLAPSILGLGHRDYGHYLSNSTIGIDEWVNNGLEYYAKSALFIRYLYEDENYGENFIREIFTDDSLSSLESIKYWIDFYNYTSFNNFFDTWVINTLTNNYPVSECISDVSPNINIFDLNNDIYTTPDIPPYSFYNILIPAYLDKNELLNLDNRDKGILHNYNSKELIEEVDENYWVFPDSNNYYDYLYTFINHESTNGNNEIEINYSDPYLLNTIKYDDNDIDLFLSMSEDKWNSAIIFNVDTSAMLTNIEYMVANSENVNMIINKGNFNYSPQIDTLICKPTGTGWNRINISQNKIFVNKENVYVVIEMENNAMGFNNSTFQSNSYYSLSGNLYSSLPYSYNGDWAVRLSYIDTNYVSSNDGLYNSYIYPNPYNPIIDINLTTYIYVEEHQKYNIDIYDINGGKIKNIYSDYPAIDLLEKITWDGTDTNGILVSSGIYILRHNSYINDKSYFFTVIK